MQKNKVITIIIKKLYVYVDVEWYQVATIKTTNNSNNPIANNAEKHTKMSLFTSDFFFSLLLPRPPAIFINPLLLSHAIYFHK